MAAYEAQFQIKRMKGLAKKAASLGYKLVPLAEGQGEPA
jgi:hypothetical protein